MTKLNKKGFTIVELVIVIAVIAILAAVLIPTFSSVIEKANVSSALTEAKNAMTDDLANAEADYANMTKYRAVDVNNKTTKQYYYVSSYEGDAEKTTETTDFTVVDGVVSSVAAGPQVAGTTYYVLGEFSGIYDSTANTYTVVSSKGYKCVFDVDASEWTVESAE